VDSPTLILDEDERTLVSPPSSLWLGSPSGPVEGPVPAHSHESVPACSRWTRRHASIVALAAVAAATIGALVGWLIHERAIASQLRQQLRRSEQLADALGASGETGASFPPRIEPVQQDPDPVFPLLAKDDDRIRRGAELLVENRFSEALQYYHELSEEQPEQAVFQDIIRVIEAKLGCHRDGGARRAQCD